MKTFVKLYIIKLKTFVSNFFKRFSNGSSADLSTGVLQRLVRGVSIPEAT